MENERLQFVFRMEKVAEEAGVMRLRVQKGGRREQGGTKKLLGRKGKHLKKCKLNRLFLVNGRPNYLLRVRNQSQMNQIRLKFQVHSMN